MTTIAFDGKILAADTLVGMGDTRFGYQSKIEKLNDGSYIAMVGSLAVAEEVVAWLNGVAEGKPEPKEDDHFCALLLKEGERPMEFDKYLRTFAACVPWAGGSGANFALAAMACGKDAAGAVEIAIQLDKHSGGAVEAVAVA